MAHNLFHSALSTPDPQNEFLEILLRGGSGLRVERIVSHGHTTPEGQWYDQDEDEWAAVLQGEARLLCEDGQEIALAAGDSVFLPKRMRHRVIYTSSPCVWLTIFASSLEQGQCIRL
jgi:cupin 2 domain-containing protein